LRQVGEHARAERLYVRLVAEYGAEDRLARLDARTLAERVKYVQNAYDGLASTRVAAFRYADAADTYEAMASNDRLDASWRRSAAMNALLLAAALENDARVARDYRLVLARGPSAEQRSRADFLVADRARKKWDASAPDEGARKAAEAALASFLRAHGDGADAIAAGTALAKVLRASGDARHRAALEQVVRTWGKLREKDDASSALAAQATLALLDDEIERSWDAAPNRKGSSGTFADLERDFAADIAKADAYDARLRALGREHPTWAAAAIARSGLVYAALWRGLYDTTTGRGSCMVPPRAVGPSPLLAQAEKPAIRALAEAARLARARGFAHPFVDRARRTLGYYVDILGEAKVRAYTAAIPDPLDPTKMLELEPSVPGLVSADSHPPVAATFVP
jgi:hypothetical protein